MERYRSKIADLNLPHQWRRAPVRGDPLEFRRDFWQQKTEVPALSYDVVCGIPYFAVLAELICVGCTDGQTDTDT